MTPYAQTNIALYEELRRAGRDLAPVAEAYGLAARIFAGRYRRSGKPFVAHVVGTASILAAHGAETHVVCAGLLHSAYTHGDFGQGRDREFRETAARDPAAVAARRQVVRGLVGEAGEDLVYGYATKDPGARLRTLKPESVAAFAPRERWLLVIRLANLLEDCLDRGAIYAGERKYQAVLERLDAASELAPRLGLERLAAELRSASSELREPHPGPVGTPPSKGRQR